MSEIRNKIQKNIAVYRKRAGLTQEELAEKLHVKKPSLSSWEQGKSLPDIDTLFALCEVLQTDITMISGYEMNMSPHREYTFAEAQKQLTAMNNYSAQVGSELANNLPPEEAELLNTYRSFNAEGKEKVRAYVADLADNPKYKKRSFVSLAEQAR